MERLTRGDAIRAKCLDCCCGSAHEVRMCNANQCPLWIYRLGTEVAPDGSSLPKKPKQATQK